MFKKIFLIGLFILLASGCQEKKQVFETGYVYFKDEQFKVQLAVTTAQHNQGLSGQTGFDVGVVGMLFTFPSLDERSFWMKGMLFPIDVIWLNQGRVIGMAQNVPILDKMGEITRFNSNGPADAILELKEGFIAQKGVKIGDRFELD
jgi:hypothetical protein